MNRLSDLNDYMFAEMERLDDDEISPEELEREIRRARAISGVAQSIVANGNLALRAAEFKDQASSTHPDVPKMLEG